MKANKIVLTALACSLTLLAAPLHAAVDKGIYFGAGFGQSYLEPDTGNTGYGIDDNKDNGAKVYLGYDIDELISVEAYYAEMGEAKMSPSGKIGYTDYGVAALYYLKRPEETREGLTGFIRAGVGRMQNDSSLNIVRDKDNHLLLGAGLEYGFGSGFALRADYDMYDKDAHLLSLSLMKRFGQAEPVKVAEPEPEPVIEPPRDSDGDGVIDMQDQCPDTPAGEQVDASGCVVIKDSDNDSIPDPRDQCPGTAAGEKVDAKGCVLESVIELKGVTFANNSAELVGASDIVLDEVATTLNRYPEQRVEVAGYTDDRGSEKYNQQLSERRAKAVRQYLIGRGVEAERLSARGYGEADPVADNATAEGRSANRRVELHLQQ